ncbi:TPA: hypothetical protein ACH3X2_001667 [Trebouxia sp. C0005]
MPTTTSPCSLTLRGVCWQAHLSQQRRQQHHTKPIILGRNPLKQQRACSRRQALSASSVASMTEVSTPHSGYHYNGAKRRFFEGWYFKVTLPGEGQSFAWMYSIEDPAGDSKFRGCGAQVMGPDKAYLVQHTDNTRIFWADRHELVLGACFKGKTGAIPRQLLDGDRFTRTVEQGYQAALTWHQGSLESDDSTAAGELPPTVKSVKWAYSTRPIYGWGDTGTDQKSTAGWLAAMPVFEPHWQVLMAHGLSTGWIECDGKRYDFHDAPSYSEKNWGGRFPSKWWWVVCNTFDSPDVALTTVGARRGILNIPGVEEDVGLIGIHWQGKFIELVPWNSTVSWEIAPWGQWKAWAKGESYEACVEATAGPDDGTVLRAPTEKQGLIPLCQDTFLGKVRLQLWRLDKHGQREGSPVLDTSSTSGALETGGGPWPATWEAQAKMQQPLKSIVQIPIDVRGIAEALPGNVLPPGL